MHGETLKIIILITKISKLQISQYRYVFTDLFTLWEPLS